MSDAQPQPFTAIVYFHGIGQQSQYEELSRLLESFDDYAVIQEDAELSQPQAGVEPSYSNVTDNNVGYVSIMRGGQEFRFYEVYWAPITASGTTARSIMAWLIGHVMTPIKILNSAWHSRRRLRVSYLYSLWQKKYADKGALDFRRLTERYETFCDDVLRNKQIEGTYDEFIAYLRSQDDDNRDAMMALTGEWREHMRKIERRNFFVFLTIIYIVVIVPLLTIGRSIWLLAADIANDFSGITPFDVFQLLNPFYQSNLTWGDILANDPLALIFYVMILILLPMPWIMARFLRDYGGDVQLWSTYQATDVKFQKREAILELGLTATTHVLNHPNCNRVLIMAHSLGTTIAYDTLLSIGRHNRAIDASLDANVKDARPKLKPSGTSSLRFDSGSGGGAIPTGKTLGKDKISVENIEYFITMGSPVDKIYYFFESKRGMYRPFEQIVDDLRGDISMPPFALDDGGYNFRWVNFWSQEDYVSGALYTPNPRVYRNDDEMVNNVTIKSYEFPAPGRSHVGYFRHNVVIGVLYRLVFMRQEAQSSRALQKVLDSKPKLSTQSLRDWMLLASWSLLFTILFDMLAINWLQAIFSVIFFGFLIAVGVGFGASIARGALHPFRSWQDTTREMQEV